MAEGIIIGILFVLLVAAVFFCSRLDDKLLEERNVSKGLCTELGEAKGKLQDLEHQNKELQLTIKKLNHKLEARGIDYDRLLTDYHRLENENLK